MGMELNGAAVLAAIAKRPSDFAMDEAQINALATTALLGQLKVKTTTLDQIRTMAKAIGTHDLSLAFDHLAAKDMAGLVKRLDAKHPELKTGDEAWQRERVRHLVEGLDEPVTVGSKPPKAVKAPAAPRSKGPKTGAVMKSKALKARGKAAPSTS